MKDEAGIVDPLGEVGVLGQEAVTRMNGAGIGHLGGADDRRHVEVAQSADCGGPMQTVSSASNTCFWLLSAVEWTATVLMPSSRHARCIRSAISPRFAITILSIIYLVLGWAVQAASR